MFMNESFIFTLNEEELLEYMKYIFALNSKNKKRCIWIRISIPAFLLFTLFYFKLYNHILIVLFFGMISVVWFFIISTKIWNKYLNNQLGKWYSKYSDKSVYSRVWVNFNDKNIIVNDIEINYNDLYSIVPLKHVLLFFYSKNNVFMVPLRSIGDDEKIKTFSLNLNNKRKEFMNAEN